MSPASRAPLITPVLIAGSVILMIGFAIRASFGVFQIPVAEEFHWARSEFSLAIAIQNLAWGIGQPLFGALAEKFGDRRAIFAGAVLYALGLVLTALSTAAWQHQTLAVVIGFGIAGTGFGVILAIVGRATAPEHRSMALGIGTAAGSAGQVIGAPAAEFLMQYYSWQWVFVIFAAVILLSLFALPFIRSPQVASRAELEESLGQVLNRAFRDPSYTLIFLGFFSCGYQLAFITAHFPAFVTELCGPIDPSGMLSMIGINTTSALGAVSIAVIGFFNIVGTVLAGWMGKRWTKKYLLAGIYALRTLVAAVFILLPITPTSVLVFSAAMGALWLATVPLTSGLVAHIWGLRYMGTLYGFVFLSHQIGGFLGVWLGGKMYDLHGDYTLVWWIGVGVGAFSALVHLPIREAPMAPRPA
ncbi:MFS transporter [Pseudogemmobacter humi]|uniref:Multidrug resistance protein MdtH n=1 Tax=Pseudogemmobacter humi TaxID=2483812 RepID=A0A3P5WXI4_9RHOB|nr:MFS transporter [Pseudogemmobacter humi]VDC23761.1 multidrug resistance protein MdtH [Pseudogemmobacter humi]